MNEHIKCLAIIQARMGSSRLPGKVLRPILGMPIIKRVVERISRAKHVDACIVATTVSPLDDELAAFLEQNGIRYFRGSEDDVLDRFCEASELFPSDLVVRATSDNPLVCPDLIDKTIEKLRQNGARYAATRGYPLGIGVEVFERPLLFEARKMAGVGYEHEHVTPYMYQRQNSRAYLTSPRDLSHIRCTIDTEEDFSFAEELMASIGAQNADFTLDDVIRCIEARPELLDINKDVHQKGLGE